MVRKREHSIWAVILAAVLLVAVGIVVGLNAEHWFGRGTVEPQGSTARLSVDKNAGDKKTVSLTETAPGVCIPGWATLYFPADTTEVTSGIDLYNPEENAGQYDLTFAILLQGEGGEETLFQSGLVEPGKHIQAIELSRPLAAGSYNAVIHVQPYTRDGNQIPLNTADLQTEIKVE